jgi:hypothetical protein
LAIAEATTPNSHGWAACRAWRSGHGRPQSIVVTGLVLMETTIVTTMARNTGLSVIRAAIATPHLIARNPPQKRQGWLAIRKISANLEIIRGGLC